MCVCVCSAHSNQSTTKSRAMSLVSRPTLFSTMTIVNKPAEGTAAAPTAASVAVILGWEGRVGGEGGRGVREGRERREGREGGNKSNK